MRFAVVGTNWITERLLSDVSGLADFSLNGVYSRTREKAEQFAAHYHVDNIFTSIEEMAKSECIDAVYIASPNSLHAEQAITFMKHGKHVLCEKPLASNVTEVEAMIQTAKQNGVLLMEAMKTTLLPNFKAIQHHLHKIGDVRRFVANFCKYSSRYDRYKEGIVLNAFNPDFSNGSLMDLGVYCIYPSVVLFGKPEKVRATSMMLDSGVDGEGSVLLQYQTMEAVIMHSKISNSYLPSEIQGEYGSIIIDKISEPEKVEVIYKDGRTEDISMQRTQPSMYYEVEEFIRLIKNGEWESKINSHYHTTLTAEILEMARKEIGLIYPADQQEKR